MSINYDKSLESRIEPLHLAIFLTKDSPLKFDMDPRSLLVEKNDLNSAIKRFQTIARLWQAFNSENLNTNNLGYKSFRLVEDSNEDIVINIIKSEYTLNNLRGINADHFNMIHQSIKKDPLYAKKSSIFNLHVACLILDSHWDPVKRVLGGHNALGGSNGGQLGDEFIPIKQNVDDLGPAWFKGDTVKLAKHETFNPIGNVKYKWYINSYHSFISYDNSTNWYEVSKDKFTFTFEFKSISNTNDII